MLESGSFGVYAALGLYGYDMVYELMTPEERRRCEEQSVEFLRREKWRQRASFMHAVGVYGSGVDDELVAGKLSSLYTWLVRRREHLDRWARYRGGDGNSHGYIGQHEYVGTMGAIQAWRTATGEDLLEGFDWARLMPTWRPKSWTTTKPGVTTRATSAGRPTPTTRRPFAPSPASLDRVWLANDCRPDYNQIGAKGGDRRASGEDTTGRIQFLN